jgi:hypothetical protein
MWNTLIRALNLTEIIPNKGFLAFVRLRLIDWISDFLTFFLLFVTFDVSDTFLKYLALTNISDIYS